VVRRLVGVVDEQVRRLHGALFGNLTQAKQVIVNASAEDRLCTASTICRRRRRCCRRHRRRRHRRRRHRCHRRRR